ncbi:hypothetical protein GCM10010218_24490 [Streptomyces mashuensis]|uniref:Transcriptional regulator WhiB n=1 Tax=Streptomyces mashuensis TaxID=33904 RepID=A0A919EBH0_9ACTN|nr:WhiB family transcriptional regulator [Streptomyces mashuensis]GHF42446.1 hypothetical protein GCM10010218_24490 [Streptomyces mashuensis]
MRRAQAPTIRGTVRPHLRVVKGPWTSPRKRRPGGPPVAGVDLAVVDGALCRGPDADLFFEESAAAIAHAKEICNRCPVIDACLRQALDNRERYGVFGGLTANERERRLQGREAAA